MELAPYGCDEVGRFCVNRIYHIYRVACSHRGVEARHIDELLTYDLEQMKLIALDRVDIGFFNIIRFLEQSIEPGYEPSVEEFGATLVPHPSGNGLCDTHQVRPYLTTILHALWTHRVFDSTEELYWCYEDLEPTHSTRMLVNEFKGWLRTNDCAIAPLLFSGSVSVPVVMHSDFFKNLYTIRAMIGDIKNHGYRLMLALNPRNFAALANFIQDAGSMPELNMWSNRRQMENLINEARSDPRQPQSGFPSQQREVPLPPQNPASAPIPTTTQGWKDWVKDKFSAVKETMKKLGTWATGPFIWVKDVIRDTTNNVVSIVSDKLFGTGPVNIWPVLGLVLAIIAAFILAFVVSGNLFQGVGRLLRMATATIAGLPTWITTTLSKMAGLVSGETVREIGAVFSAKTHLKLWRNGKATKVALEEALRNFCSTPRITRIEVGTVIRGEMTHCSESQLHDLASSIASVQAVLSLSNGASEEVMEELTNIVADCLVSTSDHINLDATSVVPAVGAAIGSLMMNRYPDAEDRKEWGNNLTTWLKMVAATGVLLSAGEAVIGMLPLAWSYWAKKSISNTWVRSIEVREVIRRGEVLITHTSDKDMVLSPSFAKEAKKVFLAALNLMTMSDLTRGEATEIGALITQLRHIVQLVDCKEAKRTAEPMSVWLYGVPGCGKSTIGLKIIEDTLRVPSNMVWTKASGPYFDGWHDNKLGVFWDEPFMSENQEEASAMLNLISSATFYPSMSTVDQASVITSPKGTCCHPRMVVFASNFAFPKTAIIKNEDAIYRRRHFLVKVSPLPYFSLPNGGVDMGLVGAAAETDPMMFKENKFLTFRLIDPLNPQVTYMSEEIDYTALIRILKESFVTRSKLADMINQGRNDFEYEDHFKHYAPQSPDILDDLNASCPTVPLRGNPIIYLSREEAVDIIGAIQNNDTPVTVLQGNSPVDEQPVLQEVDDTPQGATGGGARPKTIAIQTRPRVKERAVQTVRQEVRTTRHRFDITEGLDMPDDLVERQVVPNQDYTLDELDEEISNILVTRFRSNLPSATSSRNPVVEVPAARQVNRCRMRTFIDWCKEHKWPLLMSAGLMAIGTIMFVNWKKREPMEFIVRMDDTVSATSESPGGGVATPRKHVDPRLRRSQEQGRRMDRIMLNAERINLDAGTDERSNFCFEFGRVGKPPIFAIPVGARMFLTVGHVFFDPDTARPWPSFDFYMHDGQKIVEFNIPSDCIAVDEEDDVALFSVPDASKLRAFRSMRSKFLTQTQLEAIAGSTFRVSVLSSTTDFTHAPAKVLVEQAEIASSHMLESGFYRVSPKALVTYTGRYGPGDCGRPVMLDGVAGLSGRFIGFHCASHYKKEHFYDGFATLVTEERIGRLESIINTVQCDGPTQSKMLLISANVESLPSVQPHEVVHVSRQTKIRRTPISPFLEFPSERQPSVKFRDDFRVPVEMRDEPFDKKIKYMSELEVIDVDFEEVMPIGEKIAYDLIRTLKWPITPHILTEEESLNSIPGILETPDFSKSVGYPLVLHRLFGQAKRNYVIQQNGIWSLSPTLRAMCTDFDAWVESHDMTIPEDYVWLAYYKDELVKAQKIRDVNTRLIYAGPFVLWYWVRRHLGTLLAAISVSWDVTPIKIGCNAMSYDMDTIIQGLKGTNRTGCYGGDGKEFDIRLNPVYVEVGLAIIGIVAEYKIPGFSGRDWRKVSQLIRKMPIQFGDKRYSVKLGQPSGNPVTALLNSLGSVLFLHHAARRKLPGVAPDSYIGVAACGDDILWTVRPDMTAQFNDLDLAEHAKSVGMIYTSDDKDKPLSGVLRSYHDVTFLGCHPRIHNRKWIGALRKSSIFDQLHWMRPSSILTVQIDTAMKYMSAWGEDEFEKLRGYIYEAVLSSALSGEEKKHCLEAAKRLIYKIEVDLLANACTGFLSFDPYDSVFHDEFDLITIGDPRDQE